MKIILIRHGETDWNSLQKYQGHKDIPLNAAGRKQAQKVADYLYDNEDIENLYCSDLSRTKETADIIGKKLGLEPICDFRLRELNFGKWEGMTFSEVYKKYPDEFNQWYNNTMEFKIPGGESLTEILARSLLALNEIKKRHNSTIAIVTHGGVIRAILNHLGRTDILWKTALPPCSITTLNSTGDSFEPIEIGINLQLD